MQQTRLVLVNGIYFNGQWANQFDPRWTSKGSFHINETAEVQVDMMRLTKYIPYLELQELDAQAGDRLCLLLVIPKEKLGLSKIEAGLKDFFPGEILRMFREVKISLSLPRFQIESTLHLVETLQELGMSSMFSDSEADFTGIHPTEPLFVSHIIQKAFIEVNEAGNEAAAATGVVNKGSSAFAPKIIDVNTNLPFFFQIIDRQTNFVLFSGTCKNPLQN